MSKVPDLCTDILSIVVEFLPIHDQWQVRRVGRHWFDGVSLAWQLSIAQYLRHSQPSPLLQYFMPSGINRQVRRAFKRPKSTLRTLAEMRQITKFFVAEARRRVETYTWTEGDIPLAISENIAVLEPFLARCPRAITKLHPTLADRHGRRMWRTALQQDGMLLRGATSDVQSDEELVLEACNQSSNAVRYIPTALKRKLQLFENSAGRTPLRRYNYQVKGQRIARPGSFNWSIVLERAFSALLLACLVLVYVYAFSLCFNAT